jgi:hypothetical protein
MYGQSPSTHLTELSPRVAGPERTFFCEEPASWRGDLMWTALFDEQSLKFCQLRAEFSGSLLEKKNAHLFVVMGDRHGTKGDDGHALAIGMFCSLSVHHHSKEAIAIFPVVCQVDTFFFSSAETTDHQ